MEGHKRPWGWTDEDYEMLQALFDEALGNDEIAQAMDRTVSTVTAALKRRGLNRGANNCLACGAKLTHPKSGRRRRYCDSKCGYAYRVARPGMTDTAAEARSTRPVCTVCENELTEEQIRRRLAKKLPLTYCSGTCKQNAAPVSVS